ncbi:hypothetical protein ABI59_05490 [Acidobacteria bacterium Mor1]|nr:hypothetical protein ABI59_05490 [Acidobacteria bacterium Mor1]
MTEPATDAVQQGAEGAAAAAEHGDSSANIGDHIIHHVMDSPIYDFGPWELPVTIQLPTVFGIDLSITKHVFIMWVVSALLLFFLIGAARKSGQLVPRGMRNAIEVVILFIRDEVARRAIGAKGDGYLPYLLTTFFFIWFCNLIGLIPGSTTATGNVSVTAALAIISFLVVQAAGIKAHGVIGHFKHLLPGGLPLWLVPVMLVVEVLGMFVKPFALCIRLFANMLAGHLVILAFISLIFILGAVALPLSIPLALFIYCLELLVATVQAYIFTMLTATFVGMSIHGH